MYKNITKYDLDLIMRSQKGMIKQTRIISLIFCVAFIILAVVSIFLNKIDISVALFIATALVLILFVGLPEVFLKKQIKKNLENTNVQIEYEFGNTLNITSKLNDQVVLQNVKYEDIFQIVEENDYLLICLKKQEAIIMKKDEAFNEYKNFIKEKMQERYFEKLKTIKNKNKEK